MEIGETTIWADERNTQDGRYRIARAVIRGQVFWKVQDVSADKRVLATRHTLAAARAEVESFYGEES